MTSRPKWQVAPALAGILIVFILLALVLSAPKAIRAGDLASKAHALALSASQLKTSVSPSHLAAALNKQTPDDSIELLGVTGNVLAASGNRHGTAASDTVPVSESTAQGVRWLKLSVPGAVGRPVSGALWAAIVVCAVCLLLLFGALAFRLLRRARPEPPLPMIATWSPPSTMPGPVTRAPDPAGVSAGRPQPTAWPESAGDGGSDGETGDAGDRTRLVREMIRLADVSSDERVVSRAIAALDRVGVTTLEPVAGERFDPELHSVASLIETTDPELHDSVAAVIRRGYTDHGRVLREADVEIYGLPPDDPRRAVSASKR